MDRHRNHPDPDVRYLYPILELEKVLPWYQAVTLTGYTITYNDPGWLLVVRARRQGEALVSFSGGHSPYDCWMGFLKAITRKDFQWKRDKFAK